MRAQYGLGVSLSWQRLVTVFLIDFAVLSATSSLLRIAQADPLRYDQRPVEYARWSAIAVATLVAIAALVTYRRIPLTTAATARIRDRFADPVSVFAAEQVRALDHQRRYADQAVGIREYRRQLVAVIAISAGPAARPGRHHRGAGPTVSLPVPLVAAALRQFDVRLDGITIVSVRSRDGDAARPASADDGVVPDRHGTWLVLRMDPQHNVGAVAARDSVASTFAAAVERLAYELDGPLTAARVMSSSEFDDVDTAVLAGLRPGRVRRRRRSLKQKQHKRPKHSATSFWVSPGDITSENLDRLWLPDTATTAVTIRLTSRRGRTEVSVLVCYHVAGRLRRSAYSGLNRLTGRQLIALRSSLPAPARRTLVVPARALRNGESLELQLSPATHDPPPRVVVPARTRPVDELPALRYASSVGAR